MREECSKDIRSLDAEKIINIQTSSGNQYLTSDLELSTAQESREFRLAATLMFGLRAA